ncbi:hypothetical protein PTE30175_04480 [Pandoraea terrae]|uniref:Uncharacterized protein n=1 Tax=Pandoraea terrae TaxID=1537710 RepID=A0A5E4YLE4_9BURK|nr:hypothetical protein [Pandoraea terrae]VVE49128.1 hypothetical protein PTE30175_04480 [Pandoraea terrae]
MIVLNEFMSGLLRRELLPAAALPPVLQGILDGGVKRVGECVVFGQLHSADELPPAELLQQRYVDLAGYEATRNKVAIDTHCEGAPMSTAVRFLNEFALRWPDGLGTAVAIVECDNDEASGLSCKFRFHVKREGMTWIDRECIDHVTQAILIREIGDQSEASSWPC